MVVSWTESSVGRLTIIVTLWAFIPAVAYSLTESDCGRKEKFENGRCRPCPACPAGTGLQSSCGWGEGDGLRCQACPENFYNPPPGGTRCRECRNCTSYNRQVAFQCRPVIDAECGACLDGYFDEHRDVRRKDTVYPCTACRHDPSDVDCVRWRLQVETPVTNRQLAVVRNESGDSSGRRHDRRIGMMAALLGCACVVAMVVLLALFVRYRRVVRRALRSVDQSGGIPSPSPTALEGGKLTVPRKPTESNTIESSLCDYHRSVDLCMARAQQAAPWCPVITLRPDVDTCPSCADLLHKEDGQHRKRPRPHSDAGSSPDDERSDDDVVGEQQSLLTRGKLLKRPRVAVNKAQDDVTSGKNDAANARDALRNGPRLKTPTREAVQGMFIGPNVPEISPGDKDGGSNTRPDTTLDHRRFEDVSSEDGELDGTSSEGERTDMHVQCEEMPESVPPKPDRPNEARPSPFSLESDDWDLQRYGACAAPNDEHVRPYVNFQLSDEPCGTIGFGFPPEFSGGPLDLQDLSLVDSDRLSPGSTGNISQASTVLIRGRSRSPLVSDEEDPQTTSSSGEFSEVNRLLDPVEMDIDSQLLLRQHVSTDYGLQEESTSGQDWISADSNSVHGLVDQASEEHSVLSQPREMVTRAHRFKGKVIVTRGEDRRPATGIGTAPRHLAALTENFSDRDVGVESAEAETEVMTRMIRTLDEERYAQALRLSSDRPVSDLDFEIRETLNTALQPRSLLGDRNFRHVAVALGMPGDVTDGLNDMADVMTHLRRMRVTLASLLRVLRALKRLDVLYLLCVWVLNNYLQVAPPSGADCPSDGSDSDDTGETSHVPVQETVRWQSMRHA